MKEKDNYFVEYNQQTGKYEVFSKKTENILGRGRIKRIGVIYYDNSYAQWYFKTDWNIIFPLGYTTGLISTINEYLEILQHGTTKNNKNR